MKMRRLCSLLLVLIMVLGLLPGGLFEPTKAEAAAVPGTIKVDFA